MMGLSKQKYSIFSERKNHMTDQEKTFEESLKDLETIVQKLEEGDVPLEKALDQFQQGIKISRRLKKELQQADEFLVKIVNEDGLEEPIDIQE